MQTHAPEEKNQKGDELIVSIDALRFGEDGLIPAVIQEDATGEVLMVGYMNREALARTLDTGLTWFYSRSRKRLWQKGESSGHVQRIKSIRADCDQDTLLVRVTQEGAGACHEGYVSCFHYLLEEAEETGAAGGRPERAFDPESIYGRAALFGIVEELYGVVQARKARPVEGSYTSYLFAEGIDKILKKVGEESAEVLIAGKGNDRAGLVAESADLLYHLVVLFAEAGIDPKEVASELAKRRGGGGSEDAAPGK